MIKVFCEKCDKELNELGALLFSPPIKHNDYIYVSKLHLCQTCFAKVIDYLRRAKNE